MKRYITIGILLLGICVNAHAYEPKAKQIVVDDPGSYFTASNVETVLQEIGAKPFYAITSTLISNWNAAYGWGNHAGLYLGISSKAADSDLLDGHDTAYFQPAGSYLTSESDPVFSAWLIATPPIYSESDPLALHLAIPNQDVTQVPDFLAGLRAGSTSQFSVDANGEIIGLSLSPPISNDLDLWSGGNGYFVYARECVRLTGSYSGTGSILNTDPDFLPDASNWTLQDNWAWQTGIPYGKMDYGATHTAGQNTLSQTFGAVAGTTYEISFYVQYMSGSDLTVSLGDVPSGLGGGITDGAYKIYITCAVNDDPIKFVGNGAGTFTLRYCRIKAAALVSLYDTTGGEWNAGSSNIFTTGHLYTNYLYGNAAATLDIRGANATGSNNAPAVTLTGGTAFGTGHGGNFTFAGGAGLGATNAAGSAIFKGGDSDGGIAGDLTFAGGTHHSGAGVDGSVIITGKVDWDGIIGNVDFGTNNILTAGTLGAGVITGTSFIQSTPAFISGQKFSKSFVITNATASADGSVWRAPVALTITAVHLLCKGGTVVGHLTEQDANGLNDAGVDDATDITGVIDTNVNDDGTLSNPSIDANDYIGWRTSSITGTNTKTVITFEGYYN